MNETPADSAPANIGSLMDTYVALRDHKERIEGEAKSRLSSIATAMKEIEGKIAVHFMETGTRNAKAPSGAIAFKKQATFAKAADWKAVLDYARDTGDWEIIKKGVSKTRVDAYIKDNGVPPPGVDYTAVEEIHIRRG